MQSKDELTSLFTIYFGDKLSPAQIDGLVSSVTLAQEGRAYRARPFTLQGTFERAGRDAIGVAVRSGIVDATRQPMTAAC